MPKNVNNTTHNHSNVIKFIKKKKIYLFLENLKVDRGLIKGHQWTTCRNILISLGLNQHTDYRVRVKASNSDGTSDWSSVILDISTVVDVSRIPGPDSLVFELSSSSVHVKVKAL